jgi:thiol-disulfide isomerase/thioredoxin
MTKIPTGLVVVCLLVVVTTVAGSAFTPQLPTASSSPTDRTLAPALALKDARGATLKLADYKGRVVLLDFWATWCTGCKLEIPWFMDFEKKYRNRGLSAIGVSVDEDGWDTVKGYLAAHPISYPIVLGDMDILEKQLGLPPSLPVTLLIDRNGRIAATHAGVIDREKFEADIARLLQEPARNGA